MIIPEERITVEELGRKGFKVLQLKDGFRFGTDSVLLAWFAASFLRKSCKNFKVLELGANTGAVSLLVAARNDSALVDAVEILEAESELLNQNIVNNSLQNRMRGFNSDIRDLPSEVKNTQYNVVMLNPPYFNDNNGVIAQRNADDLGSRPDGRFEMNGNLDDFVRVAASRVIPTSGYICMIMHAERLVDAISAFTEYGIKTTRIMSVHSFADRNASVFLIAGKKGTTGSDLRILPPLILNTKDSSTGDIIPTEKIIEIYEKEHSDCFI